ncbi:MAG TPA: hypothetical protein DCL43_10555 [Chitinophagaceae bacterium]|jgi:hypothetical protein|nr:hypothetical protein [Chitinophagaceae bacterium]HAN39357.1 hypothetical protein [Chitinophagaceae bacterium]
MQQNTTRWLLQATIGLIFTGAGLSMAIDAGFAKYQQQPWVLYGTCSIAIFNAGICLLINADSYRKR